MVIGVTHARYLRTLHMAFEVLFDISSLKNLVLTFIRTVVYALEGHFLEAQLLLDRQSDVSFFGRLGQQILSLHVTTARKLDIFLTA